MPRLEMRRKASDNEYLHKDFHIALNNALMYLEEKFGKPSVKEYLEGFTEAYYSPLKERLRAEGLTCLENYFKKIYTKEKIKIHTEITKDRLLVDIPACPAVAHMRLNNVEPANTFIETTDTVYKALCAETPYCFELVEYDHETGRAKMKFERRRS